MTLSRARRSSPAAGFTLVELMVATILSGFVLAGVLGANLSLSRSGVRLANYVDVEVQIRGALEQFGADARRATGFVTNGAGDITLSVPDADAEETQVTYAWSSATESFYRVPGASSATTVGRLVLVTGIKPATPGSTGVVFEGFDRSGVATTTDANTKSLRVSFGVARTSRSNAASTQRATAIFVLRNRIVP